MSELEVPVLIVGGGGCGLSASIFLSSLGVDHLLIERHESTSILPKAHYLNQRSMEIYRQHGVADSIYEVGMPFENCKVRFRTSLGGDGPLDAKDLYVFDAFGGGSLRETYGKHSTGPATNLPQLRLEPLLRRHAEQRAPGRILFHHELTEFTQDAEGVACVVRNRGTGEDLAVRAQYVIGADGGKTMGAQLGVVMEGPTELADLVSTHFTADLSEWRDDDTLITFFVHPENQEWWGALVPMGPTWGRHCEEYALHFAFRPDDPARFDEEATIPRMRNLLRLPDLEPEIHQVSHWIVDRVVADRYRFGRIFLAGDAVHRHVPTAGLGLMTAIQDAHNLAWKLAAVLHGEGGEALLDSYESERRPIGLSNADWAMFSFVNHTVIDSGIGLMAGAPLEANMGALTAYLSETPMGRTLRARAAEVINTQRVEYQPQDIEIGFAYEVGALVSDGTEPPERDPMGCIHHPTSRPGHRLPHAWIEGDGGRVSTHDLIGPGLDFVVITGAEGAPWCEAAEQTAEKLGVTVRALRIGEAGDYADPTGAWAEVREIDDDGALLVRPDGHVAWRSQGAVANSSQTLTQTLETVLGR